MIEFHLILLVLSPIWVLLTNHLNEISMKKTFLTLNKNDIIVIIKCTSFCKQMLRTKINEVFHKNIVTNTFLAKCGRQFGKGCILIHETDLEELSKDAFGLI